MPRIKTKTSSFGTSKREGHDATQFYSSNLYSGVEIDKKVDIIDHSSSLPCTLINTRIGFDLEKLQNIPDFSLHLIIWDVSYGDKNAPIDRDKLLELNKEIIPEIHRKLCTGGKLVAIINNNLPSSDQKREFYPLHTDYTFHIIKTGFLMRGETIWSQTEHQENEYQHVIIFSKDTMKRDKGSKTDSITRDAFLSYTKSIWTPETGDLYYHILQLYSFVEDNVLCILPRELEEICGSVVKIRNNSFFFMI